jgi:hypothetical protein
MLVIALPVELVLLQLVSEIKRHLYSLQQLAKGFHDLDLCHSP